MKKIFFMLLLLIISLSIFAETGYMRPSKKIQDMVLENPTPYFAVKINTGRYVEVYYNAMPDLADIARPMKKLAGRRINPKNFSQETTTFYTGFKFFDKDRKQIQIFGLPKEFKCPDYSWSDNGRYFAFVDSKEDTNDLWIVDLDTRVCSKVTTNISTVFTKGFYFIPGDDDSMIVIYAANVNRKEPEKTTEYLKPIIQQSFGAKSQVRTYQDLLKDPYDEKLFEHYFTQIIAKINIKSGKKQFIGKPGIYWVGGCSPDGKWLLGTEYKRPFSYTVPFYYFSRDTFLFNIEDNKKLVLESHGVSDSIPIGGVYTGKRSFHFVPYEDATLFYVEALDGGDPENDVPFRDKVCLSEFPFKKSKEVFRLKDRYSAMNWLENTKREGIIKEYDWKRRWQTSYVVDFKNEEPVKRIFEDRSSKDVYNSLGSLVEYVDKKGNEVVFYRDGKVFTSDTGATKDGYYPVLYQIDLNSGDKKEIFRSPKGRYDRFLAFWDTSCDRLHIKGESPKDYPNYYEINRKTGKKTVTSHFKNPFPIFAQLKPKLIKYKRADVVELSGMLYLPPNMKKGEKVPVMLHSYPLEYNDKKTAGQVRGSSNKFTKIGYMSNLFFLMDGVALFKDAQFPVVGDPKTMNDTFVEQLVMNAEAAKKALDDTGVVDTSRMGCIGHSYGAFMVANLLIHTDLFKTGIAQSGAYNRTLTPFGFQSERRTFWEAPQTYFTVSPFMHADKLNEPILIFHGENDSNSGTYPIQSDRFFSAIKGNGGKVRYVKLPYEDHGYRAKESILHLLWERSEWVKKYLKNSEK
ncbi:MAG: prolyl oligopeptidase, partial [Candidatus Muiribacterium halophilum]